MRWQGASLVVLGALLGVACSSTPSPSSAADEPVFRWLRGELEAVVPSAIDPVGGATLRAFAELDVVAVDGDVYGDEGELAGRLADGTRVRVRLRAAAGGSTLVAIRVGEIGDEAVARQLLRHIERGVESTLSPPQEKRPDHADRGVTLAVPSGYAISSR